MPNARQRKPKRTGSHVAGHAVTRASIVQPPTPVIDVNAELTDAAWDTFITASGNAHPVNRHVAINVARTGVASPERSYDTKER